ncbi:MAG: CPBP family intramembrane metalloprotease [Chloroflexi bacterium]|nr:CPBP family intramembrane metalloprotease [Chloroflexota bacterium]
MNTQTVGYKVKSPKLRYVLIYLLINPVLLIVLCMLFSFRILPWEESPGFIVALFILGFGATITAFVLTAISDGKQGVTDLWGRLWTRHVSIQWLLIALLIWPVVFLIVKLFAAVRDGTPFFPIFGPFDETLALFPGAFLFAIFNGFREDFGWFGYLLPRLQAKWSALASGLVVGIFWGLIHLGNWLLPPGNPRRDDSFWAFALQVILASILYAWLFNNTGGKLLPVMLAHALSNGIGTLMVIPDSYLLYHNWALLIVVVPVVLIFGAKDLIRRRRGEAIPKARIPAIGT